MVTSCLEVSVLRVKEADARNKLGKMVHNGKKKQFLFKKFFLLGRLAKTSSHSGRRSRMSGHLCLG